MPKNTSGRNDWKITVVQFNNGVDSPPRSGKKQNCLDGSTVAQIMENLSEVVDNLMDRTSEFASHVIGAKSRAKPKYQQTGPALS